MKEKVNKAILSLILALLIWIAITNTIQAFKCPKMTQTELIINFTSSFVLDFIECSK